MSRTKFQELVKLKRTGIYDEDEINKLIDEGLSTLKSNPNKDFWGKVTEDWQLMIYRSPNFEDDYFVLLTDDFHFGVFK